MVFLYTGITYNLNKRLDQYKSAKDNKFTSKYRFKKLLYFEEFNDLQESREKEKKKLLLITNKLYPEQNVVKSKGLNKRFDKLNA